MPVEQIVVIDMMRTQQIIINLLTNALKFSKPKDVIRVAANIENLSPNTNEVQLNITVRDTGIGISEQDLSELFKPFFRSKEKLSLEYNKNGNGLGLHICQNVVK
jgi:signal transduction histidine kinase